MNAQYQETLRTNLENFGFLFCDRIRPLPMLHALAPSLTLQTLEGCNRTLTLTLGCSDYPNNERFSYEFVIQSEINSYRTFDLINYVVYFHLSRRRLFHAEVLKIGADHPFSHVYTAVPFFLPPSINFTEVGRKRFDLIWIVPIVREEAEFIENFGSDKFEAAFLNSHYGFFDYRDDLSYLHIKPLE